MILPKEDRKERLTIKVVKRVTVRAFFIITKLHETSKHHIDVYDNVYESAEKTALGPRTKTTTFSVKYTSKYEFSDNILNKTK